LQLWNRPINFALKIVGVCTIKLFTPVVLNPVERYFVIDHFGTLIFASTAQPLKNYTRRLGTWVDILKASYNIPTIICKVRDALTTKANL
jgi:hypothetical protein